MTEVDPTSQDNPILSRLREAEELARAGEWREAIGAAQNTLSGEPIETCTEALWSVSDDRDALQSSAEAYLTNEESSHSVRAALFIHAGRILPALSEARKAVSSDPTSPDAVHLLAIVALPAGALKEAREASSRLVQIAPEWAVSHETLARQLAYEERYSEAQVSAQRSIDLDPERPVSWDVLGTSFGQLGNWKAAVHCSWVATQLAPQSTEIRQRLVEALEQFEARSFRRHLPVGVLTLIGAVLLLMVAGRALFLALGMSAPTATWLSVPPVLFLLPIAVSLFRRYCLRGLNPEVREFADTERLVQGRWSGSTLAAGRLAMIIGIASYYVAVGFFNYWNSGQNLGIVVGFYLVGIVGGWIRSRLSKPDKYFSLRDP